MSARWMPPTKSQRGCSENSGNLRRNCVDAAERHPVDVAEMHRPTPPSCQNSTPVLRTVWRVERLGTRPACGMTNDLQVRRRMSESSPAERPYRSVKSSRAIALHVFTNLRARFRQKIIWVLCMCRVELSNGTNRRSQAAILRYTTRVSQS